MRRQGALALAVLLVVAGGGSGAQEYGEPDRGSPGDAMIQAWLRREAERLDAAVAGDGSSPEAWEAARPRLREEYLYMLGLGPLAERTPLEATVTGLLEGDGYVVEKLHYQSRPRLYVTGNLYRPREVPAGRRLPAVLYVCGHSSMGRNGNKTAFQSHGSWLARHGFIALLIDTLQLGEVAGIHHGTYREERWWWLARGYTPAGVECWNGVRGLDYLASRPDVDPARLGVTGISGGGAATFWIAAADERVRVCAPVSGMADLTSYVGHRVINGHCDCMFLHNAFEWPWTRIAALIAPRPMLFVNSDQDPIFPMDANDRVAARLERFYSLYGAGDRFDALVSIGGHDYRQDIRRGVYRFLRTWLEGDAREVEDSEVDLSAGGGKEQRHPIAPERLRVFPEDTDLPADALNATIDLHFVPRGDPGQPGAGGVSAWRDRLVRELRRVSLRRLPEPAPAAALVAPDGEAGVVLLETEPGIRTRLETLRARPGSKLVYLVVRGEAGAATPVEEVRLASADLDSPDLGSPGGDGESAAYVLEPRGTGAGRWTQKSPPNYVERAHVLLGTTVDSGRVRDILAAARHLQKAHGPGARVVVAASGARGVLAALAALLDPSLGGVRALDVPSSFEDPDAPRLLNVLRVCDVPQVLGALAPRPLTVRQSREGGSWIEEVEAAYRAAGAEGRLKALKRA